MHLQKSNTRHKTDTEILSHECQPRNLHIYTFSKLSVHHHHLIKTVLITSVGFSNHKVNVYYNDFNFALNEIVSSYGKYDFSAKS